MDLSQLEAGRQMYVAIMSFSGVCLDPCGHDDCQRLLGAAARWRQLDPMVDKIHVPHPRFDEDIEPLTGLIDWIVSP